MQTDQSGEALTWFIENGTVHIYCDSDEQATALQSEVQSINGHNLERDGDFLYAPSGIGDDDWAEAQAAGHTDEEISEEFDRIEAAIVAELERQGFDVTVLSELEETTTRRCDRAAKRRVPPRAVRVSNTR